MTIVTVGHSNSPQARFMTLVGEAAVEELIDVRSIPASKIAPHFSRHPLERALRKVGIRYVFAGDALGGRPRGDDFYDPEGFVRYYRIAEMAWFKDALRDLIEASQRRRVAIMCSEEDPSHCHRHLLIGRVLGDLGVEVMHLRSDGSTQPYSSMPDVKRRREATATLFPTGPDERWRSTRSVSRSDLQRTSSAH